MDNLGLIDGSNIVDRDFSSSIEKILQLPKVAKVIDDVVATTLSTYNLNWMWNQTFMTLGAYSMRGVSATGINVITSPHRPYMAGTIVTSSYNYSSGSITLWGQPNGNTIPQYLSGTRVSPCAMYIPVKYSSLIMDSMRDLVDVTKRMWREIVTMQNNTFTGGTVDMTKLLAYSSYSKVSSGILIPPIMPMVKGLVTLFGAVSLQGIVNNNSTLETQAYELNRTNYPIYSGQFYTQGCQPVGNASNVNTYIQWQYITFAQYLAMGTNSSFASGVTAYNTIMAAGNAGAHIFVPVLSSMCQDPWALLAYALSFSGFNGQNAVDFTAIYNYAYSNDITMQWDLPCGYYVSGGSNVFFVTFILLDSMNNSLNAISVSNGTANFSLPYNGFADPSGIANNISVAAAHVGISQIGNLGVAARNGLLQMIKWCAGSQFPRCFTLASIKFFEKRPNYFSSGRGGGFSLTSFISNDWSLASTTQAMKRPGFEIPVAILTTRQVSAVTSQMPYDSSDSIFWCLGNNSVYSMSPIAIDSIVCTAYTVAYLFGDKINMQQVLYNKDLDWTSHYDETELNLIFPNAKVQVPESQYGIKILRPNPSVVLPILISPYGSTISGITYYAPKQAPPLLGIQKEILDMFSHEKAKTQLKIKFAQNNAPISTYSDGGRFPWNAFGATGGYPSAMFLNEYSIQTTNSGSNIFIITPVNFLNPAGDTNQPSGDTFYLNPRNLLYQRYSSKAEIGVASVTSIGKFKEPKELTILSVDQMPILDNSLLSKDMLPMFKFGSEQ